MALKREWIKAVKDLFFVAARRMNLARPLRVCREETFSVFSVSPWCIFS